LGWAIVTIASGVLGVYSQLLKDVGEWAFLYRMGKQDCAGRGRLVWFEGDTQQLLCSEDNQEQKAYIVPASSDAKNMQHLAEICVRLHRLPGLFVV
jgi:hypothetical protein